jgi:hypothetical protein
MKTSKLIFIILITLFISGCNENKSESKKVNNPENTAVEKIKNKRVEIKFDREINGYEVNINWSPFKEIKNTIIGPAVLRFKKSDQNKPIEIITDYFSIPSNFIEIKNNQYKMIDDVSPNKIVMEYVDFQLKEDQTIGQIKMPFFFFDIDFDGSKELLITEYGRERNFVTKYKVFKLENGSLVETTNQITDLETYDNIYTDTKIDVERRRINNN